MENLTSRSKLEVRTVRGKREYWVGDHRLPRFSEVSDVIAKPALHEYEIRQIRAHLANSVIACIAKHTTVDAFDLLMELEPTLVSAWTEYKDMSRASAQSGTNVHADIAARLRGEPQGTNLTEIEAIQSDHAIKWVAKTKATVIEVEQPVYWAPNGIEEGVAGTPDAVLELPEGCRVIPDWKTGKIWKSHHIQNAFYRRAWNWMHRDESTTAVTGGMIVQLPATAEERINVVPVVSEDDLFLVFAAWLRIYNWSKEK